MLKLKALIFFLIIYVFALTSEVQIPLEFFNILHTPKIPRNIITVEKQTQTAKLYETIDGKFEFRIVSEFSISTGQKNGNKYKQGDLKTPEGVYYIEEFIPDEALHEKYGTGAFTLNYPNTLDKLFGKNGTGIWLHGTDREQVEPYGTRGCVAFSNDNLDYLKEMISPNNTCVIINEEFQYSNKTKLSEMDRNFKKILIGWAESWSDKNLDKYSQFYHPDFYTKSQKMNLRNWMETKKDVFDSDMEISVEISNPEYYFSGNLLMLSFDQKYSAGKYRDVGKKTMVFVKHEEDWLILREEWNSFQRPNDHVNTEKPRPNFSNTSSMEVY